MVSSCDKVIQNSDLLTKILLQLPAKDVTRCKCVSKQWLNLISNPWFIHSHTQTSEPSSLWVNNRHIVSFTHQSQSQVRTYLPFDGDEIIKMSPMGPFFQIIQSCNGLLLCKRIISRGRKIRLKYGYTVRNPVTEKSLDLPFPSKSNCYDKEIYSDYEENIPALYLVFDPLRSLLHFKVISFVKIESTRFQIFVYSSETNSWDKGGIYFTASSGMKVDSGVYCNGFVHWCTPGEVSMYLDVHEQCFKALPEPPFNDVCNVIVKYFGEFKGHLHLVLTEGHNNLNFDVFKLKEDYSSWVLIYHVDLNLARDDFFIDIPFHVVCVVLEGNEEDWMILISVGTKIVSYNPKDHTSRIFHEDPMLNYMKEDRARKLVHRYFETICNIPVPVSEEESEEE